MSKRRVISQREARSTARELKELRGTHLAMTNRYARPYPGTHIAQGVALSDVGKAIADTAALLGYGLAARVNGSTLDIYAVK